MYLILKLRYVTTLAYESQDRNNTHLCVMFLHITSFDLTYNVNLYKRIIFFERVKIIYIHFINKISNNFILNALRNPYIYMYIMKAYKIFVINLKALFKKKRPLLDIALFLTLSDDLGTLHPSSRTPRRCPHRSTNKHIRCT